MLSASSSAKARGEKEHYAHTTHYRCTALTALGVCCAVMGGMVLTPEAMCGRVEHVMSGQATHFRSLEELLVFMARVLTQVRAEPPQKP